METEIWLPRKFSEPLHWAVYGDILAFSQAPRSSDAFQRSTYFSRSSNLRDSTSFCYFLLRKPHKIARICPRSRPRPAPNTWKTVDARFNLTYASRALHERIPAIESNSVEPTHGAKAARFLACEHISIRRSALCQNFVRLLHNRGQTNVRD